MTQQAAAISAPALSPRYSSAPLPGPARPPSPRRSPRSPPVTRVFRCPAGASPTPSTCRAPRKTPAWTNLLLSLIGPLVGVALVNTLVVATLRHRDELEMLTRVGATTRQLLATMACQAAAVTLIGVVLGIAAQLATVTAVSTMVTGSPVASVPWSSVTIIFGVVALLTGLSILAPTTRLVMRGL